jgi:hypothetical protein
VTIAWGISMVLWSLGSLVAVQSGYLGGIYLRSALEHVGIGVPTFAATSSIRLRLCRVSSNGAGRTLMDIQRVRCRYSDSGVLTAPCGGADNSSDVDRFSEIGLHIWSTIYLTIHGRVAVLKSGLVLAVGVAGPRSRRAESSRSRIAREQLFRRWRDGTRSVLSICSRWVSFSDLRSLCRPQNGAVRHHALPHETPQGDQ